MKKKPEELELNQSEINFLSFLKINYENRVEEEIIISLQDPEVDEAQAVISFFDPYIKAFENHQYCSRKCVGEIANDEREEYVILTQAQKKDCEIECYDLLPPRGKKETFSLFSGDRICNSLQYEEKVKLFPVPMKDKNGSPVILEYEGKIIKFYENNQYQEKQCYIVKNEYENFDHSTCKKEKCKNEAIDKFYVDYQNGQPCALINNAGMIGNKCCWVIENADMYESRFSDLSFSKYIKVIETEKYEQRNEIKIDILEIKNLDIFKEMSKQKSYDRSFNCFMKKYLKAGLLNKKNIGFGFLIGGSAYRFSMVQTKKRNALFLGLFTYVGVSFGRAYLYRHKDVKNIIVD